MARQVVEYPENVGIIGDTGSGKTIVAILVTIALGEKTLVTAPTRFLAQDHLERFGTTRTTSSYFAPRKPFGRIPETARYRISAISGFSSSMSVTPSLAKKNQSK